jgi:alpha 1,6-mannosyltransferase
MKKMNNKIPKVINQIWLDKEVDDNEIPPTKYLKLGYPQSWIILNKDFHYKLWNRKKIVALFDEIPEFKPFYKFWLNLAQHIERCDFSRFMIMFARGGMYCDLDFKCVKDITPLIENKELQIFFEPIGK